LAWTVEYDPRVEKDLKGIDRAMQREILDYIDTRIATDEDPCRFGKPLRHELRGLWRYRVRDSDHLRHSGAKSRGVCLDHQAPFNCLRLSSESFQQRVPFATRQSAVIAFFVSLSG
jgi:mRNA interferase RelE/StbE